MDAIATECGRGCQLPEHSTVGRMHGEPHDTECRAMHASLCMVGQVRDRWGDRGGRDRW